MPKLVLGVVEFGKQLIQTDDLDPIYSMLWKANLPPGRLRRWLIAYWSFYHSGTCCWIVDQPNYWEAMATAAASKDYPRASERRHFRGNLSITSVARMRERSVEGLFDFLTAQPPVKLSLLISRVKTLYGFGDWIAFKVGDMLERLNICRVVFDEADAFLFDSPREAAELVLEKYGPKGLDKANAPAWAMDYLKVNLGNLLAPPRFERKVNGQEFETILCKWKSHLAGSYPVGKDKLELRHALGRFDTPLCSTLTRCL